MADYDQMEFELTEIKCGLIKLKLNVIEIRLK